MARKSSFSGELIQIRVNQTGMYLRQWAVPRGEKKPYIISETVRKDSGEYVRKHQWVCGCMDWISRRQKLFPPHDRCKHIDEVIRRFEYQNDTTDQSADLLSLFDRIEVLPTTHFEQYQPYFTVNNNWSGRNIPFKHILGAPQGAIVIEIEGPNSMTIPAGYIHRRIAYLSIERSHLAAFDQVQFFKILSKRKFSPKENALLLAMEEQRNRMEKNFGESVINEIQMLNTKLTSKDKQDLDRLVESGTIDNYTEVGSSIVLDFNQRSIVVNNSPVWTGDYKIFIGKMPQFGITGKNIVARATARSGGIHPHVNAAGHPCLAGYNQMVVKALQQRDWIKFSLLLSDFLTQYNSRSSYLNLMT